MKALFILNDAPYGTERSYNGLRLAKALADKKAEVCVFLMADAVARAKAGQKAPQGYFTRPTQVFSLGAHLSHPHGGVIASHNRARYYSSRCLALRHERRTPKTENLSGTGIQPGVDGALRGPQGAGPAVRHLHGRPRTGRRGTGGGGPAQHPGRVGRTHPGGGPGTGFLNRRRCTRCDRFYLSQMTATARWPRHPRTTRWIR